MKVTGGNANVRSGPGLGYSQLTVMHSGDTATYLGESSVDDRGVTWYKVKFDGVSGWVSSKYGTLHGGSSGGSGSKVYATGDLNIRSGPGLSFDRLGTMFEGDSAAYLGESSVDSRGVTWYKVKYGSLTGWVSSVYASLY